VSQPLAERRTISAASRDHPRHAVPTVLADFLCAAQGRAIRVSTG
jgi:hypothetical protein